MSRRTGFPPRNEYRNRQLNDVWYKRDFVGETPMPRYFWRPERADAYHSKSLLATLPCMTNAVRLRPEIERCQESGREKTGILKKVFTGTLRVCRGWSGRDARAPRERRSGPRETVAQKRPMKTRVMFYAGNCQKRRRDCGGAQPAHWPLCASPVSPPRGGETRPWPGRETPIDLNPHSVSPFQGFVAGLASKTWGVAPSWKCHALSGRP